MTSQIRLLGFIRNHTTILVTYNSTNRWLDAILHSFHKHEMAERNFLAYEYKVDIHQQ